MARPGRKPNPDLFKKWKVCLPATLAGAVEFHLLDPVTRKPSYGARSELIATLLRDWLSRQGVETPTISSSHLSNLSLED